MWCACMYGIFSVKSDFLGSTRARCCKKKKRFKNYFDTNSKFPLFSLYPRRSLDMFWVSGQQHVEVETNSMH